MANCITDIDISVNTKQESALKEKGFSMVPTNISPTGGVNVFLWYKREAGKPLITRMQLSCNEQMVGGLLKAGYTKIDKNINVAASGVPIYLWYHRNAEQNDTAIVAVNVTNNIEEEARLFKTGWERMQCDVSRVPGEPWVHIWVKRPENTCIVDVMATSSFDQDESYFEKGYVRLDENVSRDAVGNSVFFWYLPAAGGKPVTHMEVSTSDEEYEKYKQQGYTKVDVNLSEGDPSAHAKYLWKKSFSGRALSLVGFPSTLEPLENAGLQVIKKNLDVTGKTPAYLAHM